MCDTELLVKDIRDNVNSFGWVPEIVVCVLYMSGKGVKPINFETVWRDTADKPKVSKSTY
jgi:hypothetical protein